MSGGRGVRGNREVSPLLLLRGGGGRIAATAEATSKEGGSWGKHGFPHGSEPKASDAYAARRSAGSASSERNVSDSSGCRFGPPPSTSSSSKIVCACASRGWACHCARSHA